jgi:hypothetical protein
MIRNRTISASFAASLALPLFLALLAQNAAAGEPTAFDLIKLADTYVGDQAKDNVAQIRSERSVGTLTPNIWYVVFYDPTATLRATEVKFGAGKMMSVKRPMHLLEPMTGGEKKLDSTKLKTDSDRALSIALKEPLLNGLTLKASQLWLEHGDHGPTWRVRLWAAKLSDPNKMADIGEIFLTCDKGEVIRNTLHPNSVQ